MVFHTALLRRELRTATEGQSTSFPAAFAGTAPAMRDDEER